MGLTANLRATIAYTQTAAADLGTTKSQFDGHDDTALGSGTGSYQADKVFSDTRTLTTGSNEDIDLSGSLVGPVGDAAVFVKVKAFCIKASRANTTNLTVSPAASNGFTGPFGGTSPTITVPPGGSFMWTAPASGFAVTAGTGDLVNVANAAGASATYDIEVIGTSA